MRGKNKKAEKNFQPYKVAMITAVESSFKLLFANQLKAIKSAGFDVIAISTLEYPENLEFLNKMGVKFIEVPIKREVSLLADLITIFKLARVIKKERIALIHNQTPKPVLLGSLAGKLAGTKIINTARPYFRDLPDGWRKRFFIWLEKLSGKLADLNLVENPLDEELYLSLKILKKENLRIQGNGIDLKRFNPEKFSSEDIKQIRKELGIPEDAQVVGCVARYVYEKGYYELFKAFQILKESYPNLWLLTVGIYLPSEREPIPRDLPQKMGIADRTVMLENRSDMERLYAVMDIFVLPTYRDCFPRSLIEASAMAKPIIASDIVGCKVVVEDGKTGILVPRQDPEALARAIKILLDSPHLAKSFGEKARQKAISQFDESKVCAQIVSAYKELLN